MNYLSATSISKAYGLKVLFENLTFGISKGQKIALVGRNGCGKSSLMRVLTGKDQPDSGEVSLRKGIRLVYLDQDPDFGGAETVLDAIFTGDDPRLQVIRTYERISRQPDPDPTDLQKAIDAMQHNEAWDYEAQAREVMGKLGLEDFDQAIPELSGGQRKRLALARALVQEPDFLVLDEPTNHLDTDTIEWLENYLASKSMTILLVTHDRYFLDRVCNEVWELDRGELFRYPGDYENFLEKKAEREASEDAVATKASNLLRKELEWLRRQPKARGTKSKAKVNMVHGLIDDSKGQQRDGDIQLNFKARRLGKKILELHGVSKAYGDLCLVRDFDYVFKRGERIGVVGPNGIGKTTFLRLVTGQLEPDKGEVVHGQTVQFGYYSQSGLNFKPGQLVIDVIKEVAEQITMGSGERLAASQALTLFGFPPPAQHTHVSELSGGEKRRLYLLRVLMENPNFLILDEPTNDLDLITLNTLEEFLLGYSGCLIIVSHDRYFMDKLCQHLFVFEGDGKIKPFPGKLREYRERKAKAEAELPKPKAEKPEPKAPSAPPPKLDKKKLSYKEKREYESLEGEIEALEAKKEKLESQINSGESDYQKLESWSAELKETEAELEKKSDRWLELAERAEA